MKNIWDIRFANLEFDYDQAEVEKEVDQITDLFDLSIPDTVLADQWRLPLFTEEQINNTSVYSSETGKIVNKRYPSWKGCSLTYLDDSQSSKMGAARVRNDNIKTNWQWREDIHIPYIQSVVEQFGFRILHTVRLLIIPEGSIGLVHQDDWGTYYKNKGFSVTLNVSNGGSPIVFLNGDQRHEAWPDKCHVFRDDCWHGIPQVSSRRMQIRINGVPDHRRIMQMVRKDSAVWAHETVDTAA